jgi:hypothetical protein
MVALFNVLMSIITKYVVSYIGGPLGWIASKIVGALGKDALLAIEDMIAKAKRSKDQAAAEKQLDTVAKDPKSTLEEIGKANENLINSGR